MNNFSVEVLSLSFSKLVSDPKNLNQVTCGGLVKTSGQAQKIALHIYYYQFFTSILRQLPFAPKLSYKNESLVKSSLRSGLFKSVVRSKISPTGELWCPYKDKWSKWANSTVPPFVPLYHPFCGSHHSLRCWERTLKLLSSRVYGLVHSKQLSDPKYIQQVSSGAFTKVSG